MEFIPLERKKISKKIDIIKGGQNKKQVKELNHKHIKNARTISAEKSTVKTLKTSFNKESEKNVKQRKKVKINSGANKKNNASKIKDNKNNNEKYNEEEEKQKLKLEKWKRLDEKKKNRLFVLRKKKIISESEIKDLHCDITGVIFPRKRNSRWCWAVFESEEKASEAFKILVHNKECFVSKPNPCAKVEMKRNKKMLKVKRRLDAKKKIQTLWS